MPSYRNCIIFLLSLIFLLRLSKPASSLFATRHCRSCKGGLSKKGVVVVGRSSWAWVMPTQSSQRMQSVLLRATKHCHYCAGLPKRRVSMIRNQPPLQSASSSSALFGASAENMDGANYNNNNECSTTTTNSLHHQRKQQQGEEEQPHTNQHSQQQEQQQQHYRPLVIVLAGPTAVGKSDVASLICSTTMARDILEKHFANYNHCHFLSSSTKAITSSLLNRTCVVSGNPSTTTTTTTTTTSRHDSSTIIRGHIISADSVQVYRANIDIGSNKPSAEELLKTPYHLVGIVDPPNNTTKIVTSTTTTTLAETATSTTSHTSTTPTVLDAKLLTAAPTSSSSSSSTTDTTTSPPSSTSVYGAADWMNDVMYVLRSLPMMNNHFTGYNTELVKNKEVDHHHRSERNGENNDGSATTSNDNLALIQRREYIDRDLNHNLVASSSTTIDNETNTTKNGEQTSTHSSNSPSASSSSSSPLIILPVVTGGTMMYLQWLVHGRPDAVRPTEEAVARAADTITTFRQGGNTLHYGDRIEEEVDDENVELHSTNVNGRDETKMTKDDDAAHDASCWEAASTYVSSLGPVFAKRVEKLPGRDWYRLRRLLEVAYTMSSTKKKKEKRKANNDISDSYSAAMAEDVHSENELLRQLTENEIYTGIRSGSLADNGYDVRCFFLCPTNRMAHFHAVDMRCEEMLLRGLLRECADLYITGVLQTESQVSRAIGYRQTLEYLTRAGAKSNDGPALLAFVDDFSTATRQYAKKQMQWFRREKDFAFIPVDMDEEKDARVKRTAQLIADMCKLHPIDYDSELSPETKKKNESGDTLEGPGGNKGLMLQTPTLSTQTRLENERQGKGMKFFLSKRVYLVDGSDEFMKIMAEADECTRLVQGLHENF